MSDFQLAAQKRRAHGKKNRQLRRDGFVPGILYGPSIEPLSVQFPYRAVEVMLMEAGGTNLIDIEVEGAVYPSLAREVQRDVVRGDILHVDFLAVDQSQRISVEVPIVMKGSSPVVAAREGILITGRSSLTLEVFPSDIRNRIVIDLTQLTELGAEVLVGDLRFGENVTVHNDSNEMLAKIVQPAAARADAELDEEDGELEGEETADAAPAE
ncbi:MAG: 50S ribosomal protein L25 [Chloroflexi bacterium]|nr:50S ribosomal protein L25 [Chloroflexota bacterium]MCY3583169.1 50S ribosomal protein L25 [Chloroflexota bacterium]MCY3715345.1 50S ribosomal protein L25 [Chloroflexota bacterium]MDE2649554.1 50S ribosomal protein L25 [Chloroflexota bacterium]MXV93257.1 50S ribosomal protein L25 [Chloroflexota bacterium]